jgi:hypothetical protein
MKYRFESVEHSGLDKSRARIHKMPIVTVSVLPTVIRRTERGQPFRQVG